MTLQVPRPDRRANLLLLTMAGLGGLVLLALPRCAAGASGATASQLKVLVCTESFSVGTARCTQHLLLAWFCSDRRVPRNLKAVLDLPEPLGLGPSIPVKARNIDLRNLPRRPPVLHYWGFWGRPPSPQPVQEEPRHALEAAWPRGSCGRPDDPRLGSLAGGARATGRYVLHAGRLGEAAVTLGEGQDFLAAIEVVEPKAPHAAVDASRPFTVRWLAIPRAIAYSVTARGNSPDGRPALWESAQDAHFSCLSAGPVQALQEGRLLPPDRLACQVPGGIFSGPVMLTVTAYSSEIRSDGGFASVGWAQSSYDHEITCR